MQTGGNEQQVILPEGRWRKIGEESTYTWNSKMASKGFV